MSSRRWFGVAAVTAVPGLITSLAAINGCVGDDPAPTNISEGDANASSSSGGSSGTASGSSSGSSSGATDSGVPPVDPDAAPSLGCPLGCLPPAPMGWTGPSAVYDGPTATKPAACPSQYTAKEVEGHQGLTVGATTCNCGAGTNSGAKCTTTAERYVTTDCSGTAVAANYDAPGKVTCVDRMSATYGSMKIKTPTLARGTCAYNAPTVSGPAPAFDKENVACGLPQFAVCSQKADCVATPIPDQPFTRLCIHKEGDVSCPSLDFTARFLAFKSQTDDRACTCTGNPTGGACGVNINNNKSTSCGIGGIGGSPETCLSGAVNATDIVGLAPSGVTCPTGTMSGSTGSVKDAEPVTFCCNK